MRSAKSQQSNTAAPQATPQKFSHELGDPALKRSFKGHKDAVSTVAFNPNLKQVISGSHDGTVMVYNFKPALRPFRFVGHKGPVHDVAIHPSGNTIVSASHDQTIRVWNNTVEGFSQVIKSHSAPVKSVSLSNDGALLLSGSDDKTLKVFQLHDRKFMFSIAAHQNWIKSVQFSPDTRLILSGSDDRTVKLWDMTSKNLINSFADHENGINSARFHPDGTCIASGSNDNTINIWDIRSQRLIQHYDAHNEAVNSIAFAPNGRYLLSSSNDSTLKIWDLRQGHILYSLYGHEGPAQAVNFSPCGDYFASSGADSIVNVWKSNLNETELELIDDFGGKTNAAAVQPTRPATGNQSTRQARVTSSRGGAINSNRKTTNVQANVSKMSANRTELSQRSPPKVTEQRSYQQTSIQQTQQAFAADNSQYHRDETNNVNGTGEELAQTLEKVVSQLDIISRTLHVLEQRVSMNEESVSNVYEYFKEAREQREQKQPVLSYNEQKEMVENTLLQQQQMRFDLDKLKDGSQHVSQTVNGMINQFYNPQATQARDDLEDEGERDEEIDDLRRE